MPHTVTPCDFTTWHGAGDRPRMFYTLQNACQQHSKHNSDIGHQVSSLHDITPEDIGVCLLQINTFKII